MDAGEHILDPMLREVRFHDAVGELRFQIQVSKVRFGCRRALILVPDFRSRCQGLDLDEGGVQTSK